jgi:DNA-binding transcriptional LysR family regulator
MKRTAQPQLSENGQKALEQYRQMLQQLEDLSFVTLRNYLSETRQGLQQDVEKIAWV